ncbi:hypothetical protein ACSIGC_11705 [Tenacibaculum sp. ZS6-P6]|uniref:hypothetical protein n=1 Tax=Tenacibaculum sp. ZS6-P6 TaxID=3447503 RepID=UPI003F9594C1
MRLLVILIVLFCVSCSSNRYTVEIKNNPSTEILNRINFIEKQWLNFNNGKKANFSLVEDIVNLSGISTEKWDGSWIGIQYTPSKKEILKWREWYNLNKGRFYYQVFTKVNKGNYYYKISDGKNKTDFILDRPIVNLKSESGKISSSVKLRNPFTIVDNVSVAK